MYHARKLVLVFVLDRDTVTSVPHGDKVILEHGLVVLVRDHLGQLVVKSVICKLLVTPYVLKGSGGVVGDFIFRDDTPVYLTAYVLKGHQLCESRVKTVGIDLLGISLAGG